MEYKGYLIFFEGEGQSYGAYSPELAGVGAVGESLAEVQKLIIEAIDFHIEVDHEPTH